MRAQAVATCFGRLQCSIEQGKVLLSDTANSLPLRTLWSVI